MPEAAAPAAGYGGDASRAVTYRPGELWPLTLTAAEKHVAAAHRDVIIPPNEVSPGAAAVGGRRLH